VRVLDSSPKVLYASSKKAKNEVALEGERGVSGLQLTQSEFPDLLSPVTGNLFLYSAFDD
jgi:hypothetical protein